MIEGGNRPCTAFAFLHIPKTAGTSLISELAASRIRFAHVLDPRFNRHLRPELLTSRDHLLSLRDAIISGEFRIIIGHMTRADVISVLGDTPGFGFGTMIRSPVGRVISEYFYYTSERHPECEIVRRLYPTIDAYAEMSPDTNVMSHYLEAYRGQPVSDVANDVVRDFQFVGHVEDYDADVSRLIRLFTDSEPKSERLNVGGDHPPVSRHALKLIRKRNSRDIQLYNRLSKAYNWLQAPS